MIFLQELNALRIVEELLLNLVLAIPHILGALLVLLVGYVVARLLGRLLRGVLHKMGVDKLADRIHSIDLVHRSRIKVVPSVWISKIVYYFLLFIALAAATDVLEMSEVSMLMNDLLNYLPYLISGLLVFIVGIILSDILRGMVLTTCRSLGIPAANFIAGFVFYFLLINVVMIALDQAQIDTDFIQDNISILFGGIVLAFSIGYGFASRPLVASLLSGFYFRNRIQAGDIIQIEGIKGEIVAKDARTVTLKTKDKMVVVPLHKFSSEMYEVFND